MSNKSTSTPEAEPKYSKKQIERFHGIVNDIAEDIDNGESRKELRAALSYYADLHMKANRRRHEAEDSLWRITHGMEMFKSGFESAQRLLAKPQEKPNPNPNP